MAIRNEYKRVVKIKHQVGDQLFLNEYVRDDMQPTPGTMTFSSVHEPVSRVVSVSKSEAQRILVGATLTVSLAVYRLQTSTDIRRGVHLDLDMSQYYFITTISFN
jgi:hypothetical protein